MKKIFNSWRDFSYENFHNRVRIDETTIKRVVGQYMDYGFIVVTADRSCEAERGRPCSPEEESEQQQLNSQNQRQLEIDIRSAGFGFVPVYGGYREKAEYVIEDGDTIDGIIDQTGTPKEVFLQINNLDNDTILEPGSTVLVMVDTDRPESGFLIGVPKDGRYTLDEVKEFGKEMSSKYKQDSFFYKPAKGDPNAYYITRDGSVDMTFADFTTNDLQQIFYTQLKKRPHERFTALPEHMTYYLRKPPAGVQEARKRRGEEFYNFARQVKIKR